MGMNKKKMQEIMLRLIDEYKAGTSFNDIVESFKNDVPNINVAWVKNKTKLLREKGLISTENRGIGWNNVIGELQAQKLKTRPTISDDTSVPMDCLSKDAKEYNPTKSNTSGAATGFQRFSGIFRIEYIGQIMSCTKSEGRSIKDILDEALRVWVKIRWVADQKKCSPDQVVAEFLDNAEAPSS